MGSANSHQLTRRGKSMAILYVGIDLAKNVFAIHGVDEHGKAMLVRPSVQRARLHQLVAALPPCTIGMEACSGAHHWARLFAQHGHAVRLMAPKFVAPYRMSGRRGKNDAADAKAICEAVQRPNMVRSGQEPGQAGAAMHPPRAPGSSRAAHRQLEELPGWANTAVGDSLSDLHRLDERIAEYDRHVVLMAREDERSRALMQLSGIGSTTATALVSTIGNARDFKNGRQLAAWLGLVPGQYSSGGKARLGGITKAGDGYLRTLLVLGAKAVLGAARNKHDRLSRWAMALEVRRGYWKAVIAIAAKNARMAWAVLAKGEDFKLIEA